MEMVVNLYWTKLIRTCQCWHLYCIDSWRSWSWTWQPWAYFKHGFQYLHQQSHSSPQNTPEWSEKLFTVPHHHMVSITKTWRTTKTTLWLLLPHYRPSSHPTLCPLKWVIFFYLGFHFLLPFYLDRPLIFFSKDYNCHRLKLSLIVFEEYFLIY